MDDSMSWSKGATTGAVGRGGITLAKSLLLALILVPMSLMGSAQVKPAPGSVNAAPTVHVQAFSTDGNAPQEITLLARDPDGDKVSYVVTEEPQHGTLSGSGPNFLYTPSRGFAGTDQFTWRALDGRGGASAGKVAIVVAAAPTMAARASPSKGASASSAQAGDGETEELVSMLFGALPDIDNRGLCVRWQEPCRDASGRIVVAGNVQEFPEEMVDNFTGGSQDGEEPPNVPSVPDDPEPDDVTMLAEMLLGTDVDVDSGPVCVKTSEACSGTGGRVLVAGELREFPSDMTGNVEEAGGAVIP